MILQANHLSIEYRIGKTWLNAIHDVTLIIQPLEIHGLVGESGSGKSTLALALMRYLEANARITAGEIVFDERDIAHASDQDMAQIWGKKINLVPQNPLDALNPTLTIGQQMTEITQRHLRLSPTEARQNALDALKSVKIADAEAVLGRYPHQLSGGMQQRVMIATALSTKPKLLVLDEPTTALDVTTQAVILDLVRDLVKSENASALYVSHNLGTIAQLCDTVSVLYGGEIMETAPVNDLFKNAYHPYSIGLLASLPSATTEHESRLSTIDGVAPSLAERSHACVFASRCPIALDKCHAQKPPLEDIGGGRMIRCWRWQEVADGSVKPRNKPQGNFETAPPKAAKVLQVRQLRKHFSETTWLNRLLRRPPQKVQAVEDVSFHINGRSTVGLVGESGSGKTTLGRAIVALSPSDGGDIELLNMPISNQLDKRNKDTLKNLRMIFQNPNDALNPYRTVGQTIGRTLERLSAGNMQAHEIAERVAELLVSVGLTPQYASRYPTQLSGGEKQRVAIARAFAAQPALIIADEPTSALDVSVQAVILNLLKDLRAQYGLSYLIISHDLEVITHVADWIMVMYLGQIVEQGTTEQVYNTPSHPYTEALLSAIPLPDPSIKRGNIRLEGDIPSPRNKPTGCPFHTRCPRFIGDICVTQAPPVREDEHGHQIRCHYTIDELMILQTQQPQPNARSAD
jgi:peptide/nickel transport system ATP-binding protein